MSEADSAMQALAAATTLREEVRRATNLFQLSVSSMADEVRPEDVVARYEALLPPEELEAVRRFYEARDAVRAVAHGLTRRTNEQLAEVARAALAATAIAHGHRRYEFYDASRKAPVQVDVMGFESCYQATDGTLCGLLRVQPRRNCSESWSFQVKDGRLHVRSEPDLY